MKYTCNFHFNLRWHILFKTCAQLSVQIMYNHSQNGTQSTSQNFMLSKALLPIHMKFPIQLRKKNHIGQVVNNVQMVECHLYSNANLTLAQCIH
jgi:hypothetical protein